jgi:hypothetical protein
VISAVLRLNTIALLYCHSEVLLILHTGYFLEHVFFLQVTGIP